MVQLNLESFKGRTKNIYTFNVLTDVENSDNQNQKDYYVTRDKKVKEQTNSTDIVDQTITINSRDGETTIIIEDSIVDNGRGIG